VKISEGRGSLSIHPVMSNNASGETFKTIDEPDTKKEPRIHELVTKKYLKYAGLDAQRKLKK